MSGDQCSYALDKSEGQKEGWVPYLRRMEIAREIIMKEISAKCPANKDGNCSVIMDTCRVEDQRCIVLFAIKIVQRLHDTKCCI